MSSIEHHIEPQSLEIALAKSPKPHRHAHAGPPIIPGEPLQPLAAGKWPDPIHAARCARKPVRATWRQIHDGSTLMRGLNIAQRLIQSWHNVKRATFTAKRRHLIRTLAYIFVRTRKNRDAGAALERSLIGLRRLSLAEVSRLSGIPKQLLEAPSHRRGQATIHMSVTEAIDRRNLAQFFSDNREELMAAIRGVTQRPNE